MKKLKYLFLISSILFAFSFVSCGDDEEENIEEPAYIKTFKSETLTISDSDTLTLSGKTLYLVKANASDNNNSNSATITGNGFSANVFPNFNLNTDFDLDELAFQNRKRRKHYVVSNSIKELNKQFGQYVYTHSSSKSRSRSAMRSLHANHKSSLRLGAEKGIFIDDGNEYKKKDATLKATENYCNVWVVNECFDSTASGSKVTETQAKELAKRFDEMYPVITNVYGVESDLIYVLSIKDGKQNQTAQNMENLKVEDDELETDTKINIVVCNLEDGFAGYFAPKDYYYSDVNWSGTNFEEVNHSNVGKYFYLDSKSINDSFDDSILTLAHEFQHMINFNMKTIIKNENSETWFDEMLSMLCEDMMQSYFNISDDDSPKNRLPIFNQCYYKYGLEEWNDDSDTVVDESYAKSYGFGAWLAREFGGAYFINSMMTNEKANMDSICIATKLSKSDLLKKYAQALVYNSASYPSFNKDACEKIDCDRYKYPMKAIDLWKLDTMLPNTYKNRDAAEKYDGPKYLSASSNQDVPAHGLTIHEIGKVETGKTSVTLNLSSAPTNNMKYYVLIK